MEKKQKDIQEFLEIKMEQCEQEIPTLQEETKMLANLIDD